MSPAVAVYVNNITKSFGAALPALPNRYRRPGSRPFTGGLPGSLEPALAVEQVSFSVDEGEIFGVVGPIGAGKTTLIHLLAGLLQPDSGEIRIFDYDAARQPLQVQQYMNRVSVDTSFYKQLSPVENLLYRMRLSGPEGQEARRWVTEMLICLGLDEVTIHLPMEALPRNVHQKAMIALALLSRPRLLLLDEPMIGLDVQGRENVRQVLSSLRGEYGTTILVTARDALDTAGLCDRVAVLDKGRVVALGAPDPLSGLPEPDERRRQELVDLFLRLASRQLAEDKCAS